MRPASFVIDSLDGHVFEGYTLGENWNGFACPYFTYNQAQQIIEAFCTNGQQAWYAVDADQFVFKLQADDEPDIFPALDIGGKKLYAIGAFSWIWSEVEEAF